jgi:P-type Ca2+ transporter type 2C
MEPYRRNARAVRDELSGPEGLIESDVLLRREQHGTNEIPIGKSPGFFTLFIRRFRGFLIWLLIVVAFFAVAIAAITGAHEYYFDAAIIGIIILINASLGAYQDHKAERAGRALDEHLETEATVIRESIHHVIPAREIVVGDLFVLKAGDHVPADGRILECARFSVDESMLTGESTRSEKNARAIAKSVPIAQRRNLVYRGTFVRSGTALVVATTIGEKTHLGELAAQSQSHKPSRFQAEVDTAANRIMRFVLPIIALSLILFGVRTDSWIDIVLLGSALIIGSIPEGLPAITTFTVSHAAVKLSHKGILVKHRAALETLGSIDVLCVDKTGTLTQNTMSVTDTHTFAGSRIDALPPRLAEELKRCALLANEAKNTLTGYVGEPYDIALIDLYNHEGADIIAFRAAHPIVRIEPFSSERRRMHVETEDGTYEKGAPDTLIPELTSVLAQRRGTLTDTKRSEIESFVKRCSQEGKRVITLIRTDPEPTYLASIAFEDPPKPDTMHAIEALTSAGVSVKMITGDSLDTALTIARQSGFVDPEGISWDELKDLSEQELLEAVERCSIFARMSPKNKLRIVSVLQANGHVVGITGDGVNDAPALAHADVGISVKNGADMAKDASDLILLDEHLMHIVDGVRSGRTIFDNMRKILNYLITSNLSQVAVVLIASAFGLIPFTAIQLLWVNFVTDIGPALALGVDPAHPGIMKRKPTGSSERLIDQQSLAQAGMISIKKVVFLLGLFFFTYTMTASLVLAQTVAFTWLVLSHIVRVITIRIDEHLSILANKVLIAAMIVPVLLQVLITSTPLSRYFGIVMLDVFWWFILIMTMLLAIGTAAIITNIIDKMTGGFIEDR